MLLKKQWVNNKTKMEFRKYLKAIEKKNTTFQNIWDMAKEILRNKQTK